METSRFALGSVWSHRGGRVVIGRLRAVQGRLATLAVVGMGVEAPDGARVLAADAGGSPLVEVPLRLLAERWKRMA